MRPANNSQCYIVRSALIGWPHTQNDPWHNAWDILSLSFKHECHILETAYNTLRLRQDGRQFPDDIFKYIFLNESCCILIQSSLKFAPKGPIDNIPSSLWIMAWRCSGGKPLSGPIMWPCLLMHTCVTQLQWVNHECDILRTVSKSQTSGMSI